MRRALPAIIAVIFALGLGAAPFPATAAQELAITFDDLPAHSALPPGETRLQVAEAIIAALKAAHAPPVYGFVNGVRTLEEPGSAPVLEAWRSAGNLLGDHTWSHMNLNAHTSEDFEADIGRNTPLLEDAMRRPDRRWFRYPFLAEGETPEKRAAVRSFLAEHGYRIAAVTMSFADYLWNEPYARCAAQGDTAAIAELEQRYLAAASDNIDYYRSLSKALFGRDIPYVLLMHLGAFDARMAPRLLALYRSRGFKLVTLERAERDPFYRPDTDPRLAAGPVTLEGAMTARGLPLPPHRSDAQWLDAICRPKPSAP
jgi:peptidoglycan/xylan/chitin deacetylase (PgdA/CDA1 family)